MSLLFLIDFPIDKNSLTTNSYFHFTIDFHTCKVRDTLKVSRTWCLQLLSMKRKYLLWLILLALLTLGVAYSEGTHIKQISAKILRKMCPSCFDIVTTEVDFLSGNLRLRGTLYSPGFSFRKNHPTIVICHGGTSLGRRLALYAVMAKKLATRGYIVLTFDFRGFGESEDPRRYETFSDLDFVHDVSSALSYVSELKSVDPSSLYVIGHSFGAGVAVMAGIRDYRVQKVISISPGRLTKRRFFGENAPDSDFPRIRMSNDMKLAPIPKAVFYPHLKDYIAEAVLDFPIHPPILLIDGGSEHQEELVFLENVYEEMTEPKGYATIRAADHYFGTRPNQNGFAENISYDEGVVRELIDVIEQFIQKNDI